MLNKRFERALHYFQQQRFETSKKLLFELVEDEPSFPYSYNLLGIIAYQSRDFEEAEKYLLKALELEPCDEFYLNVGQMYLAQNQLAKAIPMFEQALTLNSDLLKARKQVIDYYVNNQEFESAFGHVEAWLSQDILSSDGLQIFMKLAWHLQRFDKVLNLFREMPLSSHSIKIWVYFIYHLLASRQISQAKEAIHIWCQRHSVNNFKEFFKYLQSFSFPGQHYQWIGDIFQDYQLLEEALAFYELAREKAPESVEPVLMIAQILQDKGRIDDAIDAYVSGCHYIQDNVLIFHNLATLYFVKNILSSAIYYFEKVLKIEPNHVMTLHNLALIYQDIGEIERALNLYQQVIELQPERPMIYRNQLFCLSLSVENIAHDIYTKALEWGCRLVREEPQTICSPAFNAHNRIRLGYISPDFRRHSSQYLIDALLRYYDASRFEVYVFANQVIEDQITREFQELVEHWFFTRDLSDMEVVQLIQSREIDILVDLAGHTAHNQLSLFTYRPASVQMSFYPMSTGLDCVDYRIADQNLISPETQAYNREKLCFLKGGFMCFSPQFEESLSPLVPSREKGYITFASFNHLAKLNSTVIEWWACLLNECSKAKLLLKNKYFCDPLIQDRIRAKFVNYGVEPERIETIGWIEKNHLQLYHQVDIALDPFPFNGHTTTCEALWMGVPLITYGAPENWNDFSRAGSSFLKRLGLDEWIANSKNDYIAKAISLAKQVDLRANLRMTLRDSIKASNWGNARGYVQDLEQQYELIWEDSFKSKF